MREVRKVLQVLRPSSLSQPVDANHPRPSWIYANYRDILATRRQPPGGCPRLPLDTRPSPAPSLGCPRDHPRSLQYLLCQVSMTLNPSGEDRPTYPIKSPLRPIARQAPRVLPGWGYQLVPRKLCDPRSPGDRQHLLNHSPPRSALNPRCRYPRSRLRLSRADS